MRLVFGYTGHLGTAFIWIATLQVLYPDLAADCVTRIPLPPWITTMNGNFGMGSRGPYHPVGAPLWIAPIRA